MGDILNMAIADVKRILNGGFSTVLTITPPLIEPFGLNGVITKHSETFDTDALPVLGDNIHCTVSETEINDLGIVTRDAKGKVNMQDWLIAFPDVVQSKTYTVAEVWPDATLGIIRITLSKYE